MLLFGFMSTCIIICTVGFARMAYGILMPFMRESLALSYQQAGLLGTSTALGYLGMVVFVGIMAAKWGSKPLITIGVLVVALGLMSLYTVNSFIAALIGMAVLGIGTSFTYTPVVNLLVGWFPQHRGLMIGFAISGLGIGTLIASLSTPWFMELFGPEGWRYLWLAFGVISVLVCILSHLILRDPPEGKKADLSGASLIREVYLHPGVLRTAGIYGLCGFAYLIPQSFLFSYMLESGLREYTAGQLMAMGGLISIASGPVWGAISDRTGRKVSLMLTLVLTGGAVAIPNFFPTAAGFFITQVLWGLNYIAMLSLSQAISTELVHPPYAPVALGYVTVFFATGQLLGPGLGGFVIERFGTITAAHWLCCSLLGLALLLSSTLQMQRSQPMSTATHQ